MEDTLIPIGLIRELVKELNPDDIYVKFTAISDVNNVFLITVFFEEGRDSDSEERYYVGTENGVLEV